MPTLPGKAPHMHTGEIRRAVPVFHCVLEYVLLGPLLRYALWQFGVGVHALPCGCRARLHWSRPPGAECGSRRVITSNFRQINAKTS